MPLDGYAGFNGSEQDAFAAALFQQVEVPAEVTGPCGRRASARRMAVYRNNVVSSLTRSLAARFAAVNRLVGEEFFAAMARVFIEANPPVSPALLDYGEEFIDFLSAFPPAASLPYLPNVAQLEWLIARAYHAADAAPVGAARLAALGEDALGARLGLHPSVGCLISPYPVFSIWDTNARDATVRAIDASAEGEAVLIARPRFHVAVSRIDTPTYAFVKALAASHPLEVAAEIAIELDGGLSVEAALQLLFMSGAIIDVWSSPALSTAKPQLKRLSCAT